MVKKIEVTKTTETNGGENKVCPHHWKIEPAQGPKSEGTCQVCGEVKDFKNSIYYNPHGT